MHESVLHNLMIGLFVLNKDRTVVFWNRWMAQFSGISGSAALGKTLGDIFVEPVNGRFSLALEDALRGHSSLLSHSLNRAPLPLYASNQMRLSETRIQQQICIAPIRDQQQELFVAVQVVDVSAAEHRERLLRNSDRRLRTLIDALPDFVCFRDREDRWQEANRSAVDLLELPAGFRGKSDQELFGEIPLPLRIQGNHESVTLQRPEGAISFDVSRLPIDDQGELVIGRDVTNYKRVEAQLRELNQNLEKRVREETDKRLNQQRLLVQTSKMAAMGEMIQAIAHQWKQPLNIIAFLMQNLRDISRNSTLEPQALEDAIEKTLQQVSFMVGTVDDFKNFFDPDKQKVSFSLLKAVREVDAILGEQLRTSNIKVVYQDAEQASAAKIIGYPNEFKQVILSLFNNAKDAFMEREGRAEVREPFTIGVEIEPLNGNRYAVTIRDNAGGIPPHIMDKLFTPYFTTKQAGTGIGLSLCKTIIEDHFGGSITPGNWERGAFFRIELRNP